MTRYNKFAFLIIIGLAVLLVGKLWSDNKNGIAISGQPYQAALSENIASPISVPTPNAPKVVLTQDLYFGLRNNEAVRNLQQFLKDNNFYTGPITGNFFSLTLSAVKKFQVANIINPPLGYVGPKTRAVINKISIKGGFSQAGKDKIEQPVTQPSPVEQPVVVTPSEVVKPAEVIKSSLKILTTYPSSSLSKYIDVILHEFKFSDDTQGEKIAITKIRFKNIGTLAFGYMVNLQLLNSNTGVVLASAQEKSGGVVEFVLTPNSSLPDQGLMVSGGLYSILAMLITPNTGVKSYIQFSIESAEDLTATDFNNLTRGATLSQNTFPIIGPRITLP